MQTITVPGLYCPFSPRINKYVIDTHLRTSQWVRKFNLYDEAKFVKFLSDNYTWMVARFFPTANRERMQLANDSHVLLFAMDDALDNQMNKSSVIENAASLHGFTEKCMHVLQNKERFTLADGGPLLAGLTDVWDRTKALSSAQWQQHFENGIRILFDAAAWEYRNTSTDRIPGIEEFMRMRPFAGAAHISTDMIEIVEQIYLPEEILQHPKIDRLTKLARGLVCWANDLYSCSKELEHGDTHNLVKVISHEKRISLQRAVAKAVEIHDQEMNEFATLSANLPVFSISMNKVVEKYAFVLSAILRGNIDWSTMETARYRFVYGPISATRKQYGSVK
ncbi:terpene synthase family protein [Chitinophaga sp. MM2321]|uniref:terpene synthase family protein n=1 Tax=Chitinophaga sp. MM2321 TaxID=3137178 RepID=UPI0032D5944D